MKKLKKELVLHFLGDTDALKPLKIEYTFFNAMLVDVLSQNYLPLRIFAENNVISHKSNNIVIYTWSYSYA